jgi:hypothetical protein
MFADQNPDHGRKVVLQPSLAHAVDQGQFIFITVNAVPVSFVFTVLIEWL